MIEIKKIVHVLEFIIFDRKTFPIMVFTKQKFMINYIIHVCV